MGAFMKPFDELQEASMRIQFRTMYHDIGFNESCRVLSEIITTAAILAEVLCEEEKGEEGSNV
jgi:hypothetical protein